MPRNWLIFLFMVLLLPIGFGVTPALLRAETIEIAWPGMPDTLDPHRTTDVCSWTFIEACYQRLVEYQGREAKLVPSLAVTWRISDDCLIYTFVLKKDIHFSDGPILDAAAVSTSFKRSFHAGGNFAAYFPALKSIELIGPYTFRFHLSRPDPSFLPALAAAPASIVSPNAALHPPEYLDRRTLGSSPYRVADDQKEGQLVLTGRRDGNTGSPGKEFLFRFEPDAEQRAAMLEQGRVRIAADIGLRRLDADRYLLKTVDGPEAGFLAFNMDRPWIGRKDVRQALASAIDREALAGKIGDANLSPESGYLPAAMWGCLKDVTAPAFDVEKAKSALKSTGVPGRPLVLAFASNDPFEAKAAAYIKEVITGTGVEVVLKPMDLKKDGVPDGDYDLFFGVNRPSVAIPERFWNILIGPGENLCRYQKGAFEAKRREASLLGISNQRLAVIYDLQRLLDQDLPFLLLFSRRISYGVDKRMEGFDLHPLSPETLLLKGLKTATPKN